MEFKQLDIKPEGSWLKRTLLSQHGKKTIIYIAIGAAVGLAFALLSVDKPFAEISSGEIVQSLFMGGFFGFLITNNPCARNKC